MLLFHLFGFISLVAARTNRWPFLCLCVRTQTRKVLLLRIFCLLIFKKICKWKKSCSVDQKNGAQLAQCFALGVLPQTRFHRAFKKTILIFGHLCFGGLFCLPFFLVFTWNCTLLALSQWLLSHTWITSIYLFLFIPFYPLVLYAQSLQAPANGWRLEEVPQGRSEHLLFNSTEGKKKTINTKPQ